MVGFFRITTGVKGIKTVKGGEKRFLFCLSFN